MTVKERDFSVGIDVARALACLLVVVVHISATDFYAFGPRWWPANFFDSIARIAVPVFFLISGALVLVPEEPIGTFYKKRIGRVLPPLIVWSVVYAAVYRTPGVTPIDSLLNIIKGLSSGHLWYFYAIIGLYLSAPFLGKIYRASSLLEKRLFLLFWVFVNCGVPLFRPLLDSYYDPRAPYHLQMFIGYFGFLFMGAYLSERSVQKSSSLEVASYLFLFVFGCAMTMWLTYTFSFRVGQPVQTFYGYLSLFVVVAAAAFFKLSLMIMALPKNIGKIIALVSSCSLGVYCIHPLVIDGIESLFALEHRISSTWFKIPIVAFIVFVVSVVIVYFARKMAFMRRII
ncbi:acyltransferase [Pseudomonas frederiksbergensis]|uniref:Acyltransferase 3 domain-containing protein n=1 Tax=Pseudomonas frederiksbergensis TaxID=104087 RepID=A0A0B1YRV2_9PSED|nr:acyltransferase family protein [Pseudomonas frederiksbergensis]KHK61459.1 hypothetical protein JZ00_28255 [Pseudomonas frederiksbergensis]